MYFCFEALIAIFFGQFAFWPNMYVFVYTNKMHLRMLLLLLLLWYRKSQSVNIHSSRQLIANIAYFFDILFYSLLLLCFSFSWANITYLQICIFNLWILYKFVKENCNCTYSLFIENEKLRYHFQSLFTISNFMKIDRFATMLIMNSNNFKWHNLFVIKHRSFGWTQYVDRNKTVRF